MNIEMGAEDNVKKKILSLPEIMEAHRIYGIYDLIVKIKADDIQDLKDIITEKIRKIGKVRSTSTIFVID